MVETTCIPAVEPVVALLYCPCPDAPTAERLGRVLVEERLAACANSGPEVLSTYRWQGVVESARECVLLIKTTRALASAARTRLAEIHPYSIPCILELAVTATHPPFATWVVAAVAPTAP